MQKNLLRFKFQIIIEIYKFLHFLADTIIQASSLLFIFAAPDNA